MSSKDQESFFGKAKIAIRARLRSRDSDDSVAEAAEVVAALEAAERAQSAQGAQSAQQSPQKAQAEQGAIKRTGAYGSPVEQGAIRRTGAYGSPVEQGRVRYNAPPGAPVGQGAIKRITPQAAPVGQDATKRTGAFGSPIDLRRPGMPGSPRPFGSSVFASLNKDRPIKLRPEDEEGLLRPLARFGKYGPASRQRGTWSRSQTDSPEAVREVTISREQRTVQPASTMVPHGVNPDYPKPMEMVHHARSYPGRAFAQLSRTTSSSSQGNLDSYMANQGSDHRGSSPQIRNYSPEGRRLLDTASGYTPRYSSPIRAASLDMRWEPRGSSQGSLSSTSSLAPGSPRCPPCSRLMSDYVTSSPFGGLQPHLYTQRNSPLFLPLSGAGPTLGRLHVRLKYDFDRSDLVVHLIEVHNLPMGELAGFCEPYVRLEIVPPVDTKKRESNYVENNSNPYFDEHFKFPIAHDELQNRTLVFQIHDHDRFSRFDIIGDIKMEMSDVELVSTCEVWAEISRCKKPREEYQELLLSLSYLPSAQRLTIVVLKGRNLYVNPAKGTVDPFVKVYLVAEGKRTKKRRTHVKKGNRNPIWNEAFTFNITAKTLFKSAMEVCVFDQAPDLMSNNVMIGCCFLGGREDEFDRDHWVEVTDSPRKTVAMWHTLR